MILPLRELAQMLRVNERTILRMLKSGQLQGAKIGGQWRFNSSQIDGLFFPGIAPREDAEEIPLIELTRSHIGIPLSRVMSDTRMVLSLTGRDPASVIEELTNPRMLNPVLLDVSDLRQKCLAREELLSTGVGNGVALPHPRDPVTTLRAPAVIVFGRCAKGIEFKAADGKPVHLFFLMCSQSIELHLHLMGRMARLLRQDGFIAKCLACPTAQDVMRMVIKFERDEFLTQG